MVLIPNVPTHIFERSENNVQSVVRNKIRRSHETR